MSEKVSGRPFSGFQPGRIYQMYPGPELTVDESGVNITRATAGQMLLEYEHSPTLDEAFEEVRTVTTPYLVNRSGLIETRLQDRTQRGFVKRHGQKSSYPSLLEHLELLSQVTPNDLGAYLTLAYPERPTDSPIHQIGSESPRLELQFSNSTTELWLRASIDYAKSQNDIMDKLLNRMRKLNPNANFPKIIASVGEDPNEHPNICMMRADHELESIIGRESATLFAVDQMTFLHYANLRDYALGYVSTLAIASRGRSRDSTVDEDTFYGPLD